MVSFRHYFFVFQLYQIYTTLLVNYYGKLHLVGGQILDESTIARPTYGSSIGQLVLTNTIILWKYTPKIASMVICKKLWEITLVEFVAVTPTFINGDEEYLEYRAVIRSIQTSEFSATSLFESFTYFLWSSKVWKKVQVSFGRYWFVKWPIFVKNAQFKDIWLQVATI